VQTGYRGRVPVVECLTLTDALRNRVRTGDLMGIAPEKSLMDAARCRVERRETTVAELERVLGG
jgi:type II secretory ATPase GspE/PulE/Tfp pilus assembly ATPase PilB-like protein